MGSIGVKDVEGIVKTYVEKVMKPIDEAVSELETYTRSQFAAVREELKKPLANAQATTPRTVDRVQSEEVVNNSDFNHRDEESKLPQLNSTQTNNDWDEPLAKLVGTGMRSAGIAKKLIEMGYVNSKGGQIDRQSVERRINRLPELKELYRKTKPE